MGWAERHPGKYGNPIGLFGDDCKYTDGGDKLIVLHLNSIIQDRCNAGFMAQNVSSIVIVRL